MFFLMSVIGKNLVLQVDKNKDGKVDEKISASKNENIKK